MNALIKRYKLSNENGTLVVLSPIDGEMIGSIQLVTDGIETMQYIEQAQDAFDKWRNIPAPKRGEIIRLFGEKLRENKSSLAELVTLECGKIFQEALGEVQEMIDICDFAVGLSRQLYGLTIASERPGHKLLETWHPLGPVAVISAFNFPVAVWAWNFTLAIVCGNSVLWKPSDKTPFTALACQKLFEETVSEQSEIEVPENLSQVITCDIECAEMITAHDSIKLVSATGSCDMGKKVAPIVAARLGRSLLELGGNNGMIVTSSADLDMALKAIVFSAVGTAGQRCTTLRRLFVHKSIYKKLVKNLKKVYGTISIGNPLDEKNLVGPLIGSSSWLAHTQALAIAQKEGGQVFGGNRVNVNGMPGGYYVEPAIVEMPAQTNIVKTETFSPILYIMQYTDLDNVLKEHNDVQQGLSSAIFTTDLREAELFLASSDCGIANVNIGPSGAEIGGAFGGEKETGGGRESGSDAWKNYMRRATNTINFSDSIPLAQGIKFDV